MLSIAARLTRILADLRDAVAAFAARRETVAIVWLGTRAFMAAPPPGPATPRCPSRPG